MFGISWSLLMMSESFSIEKNNDLDNSAGNGGREYFWVGLTNMFIWIGILMGTKPS